MLLQICKADESSKRNAFIIAIFNLFLALMLTGILIGFVSIIYYYYDEVTAGHVSRLIWVEAILNFLFFPFALVLAVGVKKDKYTWIRVWIKAKVVQASYIFLLNFVMQVYITASLDFADGLIVLAYTLLVEVFYMDHIIFMNNYHRNKTEQSKSLELTEKIPDCYIIKF